jgi:spermidine synthase
MVGIALLITYCLLLMDRFGPVSLLAAAAVALSAWRLAAPWTIARCAVLYAIAAGVTAGIGGYAAEETWRSLGNAIVLARNFYGAMAVVDVPAAGALGPERLLRHGVIEHGEQFLDPRFALHPTAYYAENSGVGLAIRALMTRGALHIGMIGLGTGTLLAYGRSSDRFAIYEINPDVIRIARADFTFLSGSPAVSRIVAGDARLSLRNEPPQEFDLLAVDAFSGDAIPVHLLTREAFELYRGHLKPEGVLAVHVTNRYLALAPVVAMSGMATAEKAMMVSSAAYPERGELASDWVLVTARAGFFDLPEIAAAARPIEVKFGAQTWTDDYSNLFRAFR